MDAVLVFDLNGTRMGNVTPKPPDKLGGPSAPGFGKRKLYVLNMGRESVVRSICKNGEYEASLPQVERVKFC